MGNANSVLLTPFIAGTAGILLTRKVGFFSGIIIAAGVETAQAITDEVMQHKGKHILEGYQTNVQKWDIIEIGIRSYSLNFCGKLNHTIDIIRRILAPITSSFSGSMIHDIIVIKAIDNESGNIGYLMLCKSHSGNLNIRLCSNIEEVDKYGRPEIFGIPKHAWWRCKAISYGIKVNEIVTQCLKIPAVYRPVSNNCHHFSKGIWNWHIGRLTELAEVSSSSQDILKKFKHKRLIAPIGNCVKSKEKKVRCDNKFKNC